MDELNSFKEKLEVLYRAHYGIPVKDAIMFDKLFLKKIIKLHEETP